MKRKQRKIIHLIYMKLLDGKLRDGAFFWGKIGNIQLTFKEIF